jgi:glycosyltransferase involved in cell wall biosynthesis
MSSAYEIVESSPEVKFTFSCQSIENHGFLPWIEKNQTNVSYVIGYNRYVELDQDTIFNLNKINFAVIVDRAQHLNHPKMRGDFPIYFYANTSNIKKNELMLGRHIFRERIKFFSSNNQFNDSKKANPEMIFDYVAQSSEENSPSIYSTPYGHDLLDQRNSEHLDWPFQFPRLVFSSLRSKELKISVIIPTHNRQRLLFNTLMSLLRQSVDQKYFEIIVIDDGSTDGTQAMLKDLSLSEPDLSITVLYLNRKQRLNRLYNANKAGLLRNFGARISKSETLLFLDSDILLPIHFLDTAIDCLGSFDIISARRKYLSNEATNLPKVFEKKFAENDYMKNNWTDYLNEFYETNDWKSLDIPWKYFMTYSLVVKKSVFDQVQGFRSNFISYGYEDLDFGYRVISNCKNIKLKLMPIDVYHQFHFSGGSENTLDEDFKFFQLSTTAKTFIAQNAPYKTHYLLNMTKAGSRKQKWYKFIYGIFWRIFFWKQQIKNFLAPKRSYY